MHDYKRPPTLHRYGPRSELEQALKDGQFVLRPVGSFLTLSFRKPGTATCSIISAPTAAW
ncbi:hypothetical protein [Duganella sp. Root198D2]|uniref:hypothetical protein n=1 Tax=Duganella sp. Root198D2 TaxID=1736489 RepID=UPI000A4BDA77